MKVKPVILCGGAGTRLFPGFKKSPSKQFIDFGGWTLFEKTLERIKNPIFDSPIISTNKTYEKLVRKILKNKKIKKFKKGDIIFWKGHVALCVDSKKLIHAYGPKKKVLIMPIKNTIKKIEKMSDLVVKKISNILN